MARMKYYDKTSATWKYADLNYGLTGPMGPAGGPAGPAGADGADGADGAPGDVTATIDSESSSVTATLADSNMYVYSYSALEEITINIPSGITAGFVSIVVFACPSAPVTVSLVNAGSYTLKFKGDGTIYISDTETRYIPTTLKTCTVVFSYDGINMNVYTSEV